MTLFDQQRRVTKTNGMVSADKTIDSSYLMFFQRSSIPQSQSAQSRGATR